MSPLTNPLFPSIWSVFFQVRVRVDGGTYHSRRAIWSRVGPNEVRKSHVSILLADGGFIRSGEVFHGGHNVGAACCRLSGPHHVFVHHEKVRGGGDS